MTAEEYVKQELVAGRLTAAHIVELVRFFQSEHHLTMDGMPGPATHKVIAEYMEHRPQPTSTSTPTLRYPLPTLRDGRRPVITSEFRPADRPNHNGVDFFYHWQKGDDPSFIGDKGCAGRDANGNPRWVVPYGVNAIAAAGGRVQIAGNSPTGYRLWIDHGNGWRTGYFHLQNLRVAVGDEVFTGQELGRVGDNPKDNDGRHLHFELSPVDRYAPIDPEPYLNATASTTPGG